VLEKNGLSGRKHLVFTSAFHFRRALMCFRKAGLNVEGFSTDFRSDSKRSFTPDKLLIPDPEAYDEWQMVIREIEGIFFYKLAGYI
jgi:uncharacterized SAM-binding protein YcdF (DUF218 family)